MTELGDLKQGDDKKFPDIVFTYQGSPEDLTGEDWTVAVQLRPSIDSLEFVAPVIDPVALESSIIRLSLPRAVTRMMEAREWVGDVEVTGTEGRGSSKTFTVVVEPDVTRVD